MLLNGKGVSHFKEKVQELLKIPQVLVEGLTKWTEINCFLSSVRKATYLFLCLFELETRLALKQTVLMRKSGRSSSPVILDGE